jgi:hypothetical protein
MLSSRLTAVCLLSLAAGCGAASAPVEATIPVASAESRPPPPSAAAPRESPEARARLDEWERKLPDRWEIERRGFVGLFSFVIAHEAGHRTGAIATASGLVTDLPLRDIWKEQRDLDGDGRADLVVMVHPDEGEDESRVIFEVYSDRLGGLAALPTEGIEPAPYRRARWAEGDAPAIELGTSFTPAFSQIFAWNGKALAPRDRPFLYLTSWSVAHAGGDAWKVVGLAHGKQFERTFDPGMIESITGDDLDDLGDGPHFYLFRWHEGAMRGMSEEEMNNPAQALIALRVEEAGITETNLSDSVDLTSRRDRDGDKVPEFEVGIPSVAVTSCLPKTSPCQESWVGLKQLTAWVGDRFASDAARLAPAYLAWAADAAKEADAIADEGGCSIPRIELAMQAYMGLRRGGKDRAAARAEAERLLRGATTSQCAPPGARARPVATIAKEAFQKLDDTLSPPPPRPRPKARGKHR